MAEFCETLFFFQKQLVEQSRSMREVAKSFFITQNNKCPDGGIGRRAGLKHQ